MELTNWFYYWNEWLGKFYGWVGDAVQAVGLIVELACWFYYWKECLEGIKDSFVGPTSCLLWYRVGLLAVLLKEIVGGLRLMII